MAGIKNWIKRHAGNLIYNGKTDPGKLVEMTSHVSSASSYAHAAFNIFTDQGEDGIIHYLLNKMIDVPPVFADLGSGDCINSNCATLAVHGKWKGLFVDRDTEKLAIGRQFYQDRYQITFANEEIRPDNVNHILAPLGRQVGLLSIDIDGNDGWIWKAIDVITPRLVVIEAKVEFGERNCVVPEGRHNHHSSDKKYNGASVEALRELGWQKGYKLVAANSYGYNLFFVLEKEVIPVITNQEILSREETRRSFYTEDFFNTHEFVTFNH